MERVETRELEYFVMVAEELHFGRAADRLGIAQPPLSRAIGRLERRMGVQLFERTSRRVQLTAAGAVFLAEGRKALNAVDTAVQRAQRSGRPHRLVLATRPGTGPGLLANVLRAYRRQPGAAEVEVFFTRHQLDALQTGAADVGLMCGRGDLGGLEFTELADEKTVVLLPSDHHLAARPWVTVDEVTRDPAFRPHCPDHTLDQIIDMVSMGNLVVLVGASVIDRIGPVAVAVPVVDAPSTKLVLVWQPSVSQSTRNAFVRTALSTAVGHAGLDQAS
jgi:DNA-binding transcriptional LysR family regulator